MKVEIETFKEELSKKIYGEDNKSAIILIQVNDGVTVDGEVKLRHEAPLAFIGDDMVIGLKEGAEHEVPLIGSKFYINRDEEEGDDFVVETKSCKYTIGFIVTNF